MEGKSDENDKKIVISSSKKISVLRDIQSPVIDEIISKILVDKEGSIENLSADELVRMGKSLLRSKGRGDNIENKKAYDCFQKASLKGHPEATWMMYNCIIYADGTSFDHENSRRALINAAKLGYPEAQYRYAISLISGEYGTPDITEGISWGREAMDQGLVQGDELIAAYWFNSCRDGIASGILRSIDYKISTNQFNHLLGECNNGNTNAMYAIYQILSKGRYKSKTDLDIAYKWLYKAIEQGSLIASMAFIKDFKVKIDYPLTQNVKKELETNLINACSEGNQFAMLHLGIAYIYKRGLDIDKEKGLKLLQESFSCGNSDAAYYLSFLYYIGTIVEENHQEKAQYYLLESANRGCPFAQRKLFASESKVYDCRITRCFDILFDAAKRGGMMANYQIASHSLDLLMRYPTYRDAEEFIEYYKIASEMGSQQSSYELGTIYKSGVKVDKDLALSKYYFYKGSLQGCTSSMSCFIDYLDSDYNFKEAFRWSCIGSLQSYEGSNKRFDFDSAISKYNSALGNNDDLFIEIFFESQEYVNRFNEINC
jgi:TPR repeat protein